MNDRLAADDIASTGPDGPLGRALERLCEWVAMFGGLLLVLIMLVSSVSVVGRSLPQMLEVLGIKLSLRGIPGDVELVQLGCAVAVFAFLPLCQIKRVNVLVGAFTKNMAVRYRSLFDLAANLLFLLLSFVLALELGYGTAEKFRNNDTTMVLRIPEGWAFSIALVFAWLLVVATAYTVVRSAMEVWSNHAIGPRPSGEH